jgi:cell pole-organizing protein PopZ
MSESERARANSAAASPSPGGVDPSMEDILASIRRILAEEEGAAPATPALAADVDDGVLQLDAAMMLPDSIALPESIARPDASPPVAPPAPVVASPPLASPSPASPVPPLQAAPVPAAPSLVHETSVQPQPLTAPPGSSLMAPEAAAATATSVGSLVRTLAAERATQVYGGGPTIEDLVRAELRPLLKEWLDAYLPGMVERLVRAEIERVVGRVVP